MVTVSVTNRGEARTVDFLAVFAEGETRTFTAEEIKSFVALSGVPLTSGVLSDSDSFEVVANVEGEEG
jgi:hypothetical protein